jgi:bifunctional ADP-heptose synthase (sugar kinase/adenylyltransferase)
MKYSDWQLPKQAFIAGLGEATLRLRDTKHIMELMGEKHKVILTSGGYDPIHPGHISCMNEARERCAQATSDETYKHASLVVVVNGDDFLRIKKGRAFMPLKVRSQIVSAISGVSIVVPFNPSDPKDMTVCEALAALNPDAFAKGGDRTGIENIPEWATCQEHGIEVVTGCGDEKHWSSSRFLEDFADWAMNG